MSWQLTPYAIPLLVGSALLFGVAAISWQRRSTSGAIYLVLLSLGAAVYSLGYIGELGSTSIQDALVWIKIEYIGITTAPVILFVLVLVYTGNKQWVTPLSLVALLAISAMTLLFAWTNEQHQMMWVDPVLAPLGRYFVIEFTPGEWYWVHIAYLIILATITIGLLLWTLRRASGLYRNQLIVLLSGAFIPLLSMLLYLSKRVLPGIDLTPYALILMAVVIAWGLFYTRLLDIMPVAREAVLNSMTDAIIVVDSQYRLVDFNPVARQLASMEAQQAVGQPIAEVFPRWSDVMARLEGNQSGPAEVKIDVQGEERSFDMRLSPLFSGATKQAGQMLVLRDITDRVKVEDTLRETNDWLRTLRKLDGELSRKLDVDYVITIALDAAMRMSLADAAFIALSEGEHLRIVHGLGAFPPEYINKLMGVDTSILARVARTRQAELVTDVSADPDYLSIVPGALAQITLPLISGAKLVGVVALEAKQPERFTIEIFEALKLLATRIAVAIDNARMYEDRQQLVEDLDAFAHTVAHDLKNPLSTIGLSSQLLMTLDPTLSGNEHHEFAQTIDRGVRKMRQIIENLLLLASVRGTGAVKMEPLDMRSTVAGAMEHLTLTIQDSEAEIVIPDSWPKVLGHGPWVEEIWANYIGNAIKYGGEPPRVELGFDMPSETTVRFWVRDNGKGISQEDLARLFQPFSRLGDVKVKGHGLGLSIVGRIAKKLGGDVGVESQLGQGSLFYFTLPIISRPDF